jgi:hypothetical protein
MAQAVEFGNAGARRIRSFWVRLRTERKTVASRLALASVICASALLTGSVVALADSASITVTNTAGQSDPAAGVPRVFTIAGTAGVPERVFVKFRAVGGAPCAPNAQSDSGSTLGSGLNQGYYYFAYGQEVNGTFSLKQVYNWSPPGSFAFCIWLAPEETSITTPITQTIGFRSPVGTITASVGPATPSPGQQATVTVTGSSESPARVYAKLRSAGGAGCAPTDAADSGENVISGTEVNGSFSTQATTTQLKAGQYVLCLWLAQSAEDTSPIAGPQPIAFTVALPPPPSPPPPPPPPPCVVPSLSSSMRLLTVERRIRAAHCRIGRIRYAHARHVRRGNVVRISPRPHTWLAHGAYVAILVSAGA